MADEDPGRELPQRVRDAARSKPPARAPTSPVLSEELRQRIRAAVTAERAGAGAAAQAGATDAETSGPDSVRPVRPGPSAWSKLPARPARSANADHRAGDAGLPAEDEVTECLSSTAKPPSETTSRSDVKPRPLPQPWPGIEPGAGGKSPVAVPSPAGPVRPAGRSAARRAIRLVAVVVVIGVLAVTAVRYFDRPAAGGPADAAARRASAAARGAAAIWVARQVSRNVKVSCDPVMCAALRARGFPPGELLVLGSASEVPTSSVVVVETPAVLSQFGSSLAAAWAPAVLASFGFGPSLVTVRAIASSGAATYRTRLSTDLADRKTAGAALLDDQQISVTPRASGQLTAGAVDSRLLLALAALAGHQPISIVRFGNPGPRASPGVPLRYADLAERDPGHRVSSEAYVRALRADLGTLAVMLRPAGMAPEVLADGQAVLRVEFTAPSPLGLLGPQASS